MNITICVDVSESMGYGKPVKIEQAKNVIIKVAEAAPADANFTLITFDSEADVRIKNCDMNSLRRELNAIRTRGVSCLSAGLKTGLEEADADSVLVFVSDGRANLSLDKTGGFEGSLDLEKELLNIASNSNFRGEFHVIAVGEDSFTYTLTKLAEVFRGFFYLAEDFEGLSMPKNYQSIRVVENLTVYPVPLELPAAQPSWSKESQVEHLAVVSKSLYEDYLKCKRAFVINSLNNREARTALLSVDAEILQSYRKRRPKTVKKIERNEVILLDDSYRSFLSLEKKERVTIKLVKPA